MNKIRNKREDITTNNTEIIRIQQTMNNYLPTDWITQKNCIQSEVYTELKYYYGKDLIQQIMWGK